METVEPEILEESINVHDRGRYYNIVALKVFKLSLFEDAFIPIVERPKDVIVNLYYQEELSLSHINTFKALEQQINSQGKRLVFIYCKEKVKEQFDCHPHSKEFNCFNDLNKALLFLYEEESTLHQEINFIKSFVNATIRTIFVQAKTLSKRKSLQIVKEEQNNLDGDISGLVNVVSKHHPYIILLTFPDETFINIINRMTGESYDEMNEEIQDGAKELMNIIFGQAKLVLKKENKYFNPEPPEMIIGDLFPGKVSDEIIKITSSLEGGMNLAVNFTSSIGDFNLRFWFPNESVANDLIK